MKKNAETAALMDRYRADISAVWGPNESMIKYCLGQVQGIAELKDGRYFILEKQPIEKYFCYGYSLSRYDTEDYDRANRAADNALKDKNNFIRENMKRINQAIQALDDPYYMPVVRKCYPGHDCGGLVSLEYERIVNILDDCGGSANLEEIKGTIIEGNGRRYYILTDEEKEMVRAAYKVAAEQHEKKVLAYLKRYGLSKVHSWSYWQDE